MEYRGFKFKAVVVDEHKNKFHIPIKSVKMGKDGIKVVAFREFDHKFNAIAVWFYVNNELFRRQTISREIKKADSLTFTWG